MQARTPPTWAMLRGPPALKCVEIKPPELESCRSSQMPLPAGISAAHCLVHTNYEH